MQIRTAEYPKPNRFLLHLSDTHFVGGKYPLHGVVDSEAHLRRLFEEFAKSHSSPDAIVVTGDLADRGEPHAYTRLRALINPVAEEYGALVVWVMGNHDNRASFRVGLLDDAPSMKPVDTVYDLDGLRIIALDTTVPGSHHGEISSDQLAWLANELACPAPHGTILALHHPPMPSVLELAAITELRHQSALATVLRGTDVRSILAGHLHYATTSTFAGIPVSVASATSYNQDLNVAAGGARGHDGDHAFNLVHVFEDSVVHTVVPLGSHATVGESVSPSATAKKLALAGVRIEEAPQPSEVSDCELLALTEQELSTV